MGISWRFLLLPSVFYQFAATSPSLLQERAITAACTPGATNAASCITGTLGATVKTGVVSGTTLTETFYPTSLSDFGSLTAKTTITTVDAAGATAVIFLAAAGVGYLAIEGAGSNAAGEAILLEPPPFPTPSLSNPDLTTPQTSGVTPTSTSVSITYTETQTRDSYNKSIGPVPPRITIPDDVRSCNPQGSNDPSVRLDYVNSTVHDFCSRENNQEILNGPADEIFSIGAGVELNVSVSALNIGCGISDGQTELDTSDCEYYLSEALNGCDTNSNTNKYGGSVDDGCFHYSIQPGYSDGNLTCALASLPNLPNLPGSSESQVTYESQTGMDRGEAISRIAQFCKNITADHVNGRDVLPQQYAGLEIYYNPSKGNSQMNVSLTYSQDRSCPQTGDGAQYLADQSSCERFLGRIIDDCETKYQPPYGKFGGLLTDGCGVYAIQTKNVEPILCSSTSSTATISESLANDAIDWFCSQGYNLNPSFKYDPSRFYQSPPDGAAWGSWPVTNPSVKMNASFGSLPQDTGCQFVETKFNVDGDECKRRLHSIVNECATGGVMGAQQQEGCVLWSINSLG